MNRAYLLQYEFFFFSDLEFLSHRKFTEHLKDAFIIAQELQKAL